MAKYNIKPSIKTAQTQKNDFARITRYFNPKKGVTRFRLVPIGTEPDGSVFPFRKVDFYGFNAFRQKTVSPTTFGKEDPIKKFILAKQMDQELKSELLKRFQVQTRYIAAVVVREKDDFSGTSLVGKENVRLLDLAKTQYEKILNWFLNEDEYGSIIYPDETGFDMEIVKTQDAQGKWTVEIDVKRKPSPLSPKADVIDSMMTLDLDSLIREEFTVLSDEELLGKLKDALVEINAASSQEEETVTAPAPRPTPAPRSQKEAASAPSRQEKAASPSAPVSGQIGDIDDAAIDALLADEDPF